MIKAIFFDFGGVIYTHPKEVTAEILSKIYHYSLTQTIKTYGALKTDYFSGKITTEKLIDSLSRTFKSKKTIDEVKRLWLKYYSVLARPDKTVLTIIKVLRKQKYKTYLISNTNKMSDLHNRKVGIYDYFDGLFLSFELGLCKPNLEFYKLVLSRLNIKAEECVFIDDDEKNLGPARSLGINTILFDILKDKPSTLKDKLQEIGVKI